MSDISDSNATFSERLSGHWFSVILGLVICMAVGFVLSKSEGKSKQQNKGTNEAKDIIIKVDNSSIDPQNQGKLVYINGSLLKTAVLRDQLTGVEANALSLRRRVQMYQYVEKEEQKLKRKLGPRKIGDEQGEYETVTEYHYVGGWHDKLISDENFNDKSRKNPNKFPFEKQTLHAEDALMGTFRISNEHYAVCDNYEAYEIEKIDPEKVKTTSDIQNVEFLEKTEKYPSRIYIGRGSKEKPAIGAVMISYEILPVGEYSVIGKQNKDLIEPYTTSGGTKITLMDSGIVDYKEMLESSQTIYSIMTWIFRGIAFFLLFLGFILVLRPFRIIKTGIIGFIVKPGLIVSALVLSCITSILIIEITWYI